MSPSGCRVGSVPLQPVLFPAGVLGSILVVGQEAGASHMQVQDKCPHCHVCPGCLRWPESLQWLVGW